MIAPLPSPNWRPSPVRTISVPAPANLRLRGLVSYQTILSWVPKSSADVLDFTLDPTEWLAGTGDYLITPTASVPSATGQATDLTVLWTSLINGQAVIHLGGGAPGTTQAVLVNLITQQGRHRTVSVEIAITADTDATAPIAPPTLPNGVPIPPNGIRLPDGSILTTDTGSPILIA